MPEGVRGTTRTRRFTPLRERDCRLEFSEKNGVKCEANDDRPVVRVNAQNKADEDRSSGGPDSGQKVQSGGRAEDRAGGKADVGWDQGVRVTMSSGASSSFNSYCPSGRSVYLNGSPVMGLVGTCLRISGSSADKAPGYASCILK